MTVFPLQREVLKFAPRIQLLNLSGRVLKHHVGENMTLHCDPNGRPAMNAHSRSRSLSGAHCETLDCLWLTI